MQCSYPYPQSPETFVKDGIEHKFTDEFLAYCNYMCPYRDRYINEHNSCDLENLKSTRVVFTDYDGNRYWNREADALTLKRCGCLEAFNNRQQTTQPKITAVKSFVSTSQAAPLMKNVNGYVPAVIEMTNEISVEVTKEVPVEVVKEVSVEVSVDMTDQVEVRQLEVLSNMLSVMCDFRNEMKDANAQQMQGMTNISGQLSSMVIERPVETFGHSEMKHHLRVWNNA